MSAAAGGNLNEPVLSVQQLERGYGPLKAQVQARYLSVHIKFSVFDPPKKGRFAFIWNLLHFFLLSFILKK